MTADLKLSPAEENQELVLHVIGDRTETFFLPDGVVLNIPKSVKLGEEFDLEAGRFVSNNEYKLLTARYDNFCVFTLLISEVFRREE